MEVRLVVRTKKFKDYKTRDWGWPNWRTVCPICGRRQDYKAENEGTVDIVLRKDMRRHLSEAHGKDDVDVRFKREENFQEG